jgi:hypothetical protein
VTHPLFGYRVSMRRLLEVQARLLARYLDGEIESIPIISCGDSMIEERLYIVTYDVPTTALARVR